MRLKLDENLGNRAAALLKQSAHDVSTVFDQGLCGSSDKDLAAVCIEEKRCLVTLDMDFSNPLVFDPRRFSGIAVLRLPPKPTPEDLHETIVTLNLGLARAEINGKLWIIHRNRIREYQQE